MNKKIKYIHLFPNMIQTMIFVNYDVVWFYMLLQIVMCFLLKTQKILEMNMYLMFLFSIGIYGFCILYVLNLVIMEPYVFLVLFCIFTTNFILSLLFLDFEMETHKIVYGECPICLEDGMVIELQSCKHTFHPSCIKAWFIRKKTCPMCRCDSR